MATALADERQILTFEAGGRTLALDTALVAEVAPMPVLTRVPQSPASLRGLANLRGAVVPVVSLGALLGDTSCGPGSKVVVLNRQPPLGLAVDEVRAVTAGGRSGETTGIIQTKAGPVRLLDLDAILADSFHAWTRKTASVKAAPIQPEAAQHERTLGFLEFGLAGQAYALPLEQAREVISLPESVTSVSGAEAVMLGVVPYRDQFLPLVSLRGLLGLPRQDASDQDRVVVAALGETLIGLLVDEVRAIVRASEGDIGPVPSLLNRGAGEARIDAIIKTGHGLVSVLATERILAEETVARVIAEGEGRRTIQTNSDGSERRMEQFVLFRLGDETFGLPIGAVEEIVPMPAEISRTPRAPAFVLGVMNHRGRVVPLIDQKSRFEAGEGGAGRRVIISTLGDLTAGFVVDAVEQILSVPAESLHATPELAGEDEPLFDRIATLDLDGRMVLLVDPGQLLSQTERDVVKALAASAESSPA